MYNKPYCAISIYLLQLYRQILGQWKEQFRLSVGTKQLPNYVETEEKAFAYLHHLCTYSTTRWLQIKVPTLVPRYVSLYGAYLRGDCGPQSIDGRWPTNRRLLLDTAMTTVKSKAERSDGLAVPSVYLSRRVNRTNDKRCSCTQNQAYWRTAQVL